MRILSIGFGDKKKVKYEKVNNAGITETYQLVTEDDFRPEIKKVMNVQLVLHGSK